MKYISELLEEVNELLNENEEIKIGSLTFEAAEIVKKCDPIAYREIVLDYANSKGIDIDELIEDEDF